jgi:hypothetical protein
MMMTTLTTLFVLLLATAVFPSAAHAYLDPGTGSVILQVLVAGVLGALFTIKSWWRTVKAYLDGMFSRAKKQ